MFNVSQLYSIPQFLRANFQEINERAFITIKEKNKKSAILRLHILKDIIRKIKTSSTKIWPKACFRCNLTKNFIFFLKYRQQKVDLNTSKKSLVIVTVQYHIQLSYMKISYLRKYTHLREDAAFLHFRLKKSSENMIFPWNGNIRKQTKIWFFLHFSKIFVRRKFFFSCSGTYFGLQWVFDSIIMP